MVMVFASASHAQFAGETPDIAREFLDRVRGVDGNRIRFCIYENAITADLDRAIARAIGEVLLVEAVVVEISARIAVEGIDFIPISEDELFIYLNNDCDAFLGFLLASDAYPDWLTVTRPYVTTRFVAATRPGHVRSLDALPPGGIVATIMLSEADVQVAAYIASLAEDRRWRRFPYPDARLALERLLDETVDVSVVWKPSLEWAAKRFDMMAYEEIPGGALRFPTRHTGMVLRSSDVFVRTVLDDAIAALASFGTLSEIYDEVGFPGELP
jgi:polar amino acid transport system substrate-binding protein